MRYDPTAAQDTSKQGKPGTYYFSVTDAKDATSKTGNEMIKLTLAVSAGEGDPIRVYDYLVNTAGGLWKVKLFAKEVGLDFDSGNLTAEECVGKSGKAVFDYDKKDVAAVAAGTRQKAYLKVVRYGIHEDKPKEDLPDTMPAKKPDTDFSQEAKDDRDDDPIPF